MLVSPRASTLVGTLANTFRAAETIADGATGAAGGCNIHIVHSFTYKRDLPGALDSRPAFSRYLGKSSRNSAKFLRIRATQVAVLPITNRLVKLRSFVVGTVADDTFFLKSLEEQIHSGDQNPKSV